ncbi:MAG: site-2 protease family protein [Oscillospiraceae bacterium]
MTNPIQRMQGPLFDLLAFLTGKADIVTVIISFFSVAVIILLVFPIHECAHGLMAKYLGDDTAESQGRLTLNPFDHIDPMGAFAMCLCCIGWAKPVPVNIRRCTKVKARTALALTALAGPVANFLLSYIILIIVKLLFVFAAPSTTMAYVILALSYVVNINIYLGVFNLVPIPPFDGYKILYSFLPAKAGRFMEQNGHIINIAFFALLIFGLLDLPLGLISDGMWWLLDKASFFIPIA